MRIKIIFAIIISLMISPYSRASSLLLGYEFGEMASNDFQNIAGELSYTLDNERSIRLVFMNVALTEKHLSRSSTLAVDGDDVAGKWKGLELFFDIPIYHKLSLSPSLGYYDSRYFHTILDESVEKKSSTAGITLSYLGDNVFGASDFYWRLSLSYRYYFNPIEKTTLGDTTIRGGSSEIVPWIFIGYRLW